MYVYLEMVINRYIYIYKYIVLGALCLRDEDVDEKHQPRCPCQAGLVCRPTSTLHTEVINQHHFN